MEGLKKIVELSPVERQIIFRKLKNMGLKQFLGAEIFSAWIPYHTEFVSLCIDYFSEGFPPGGGGVPGGKSHIFLSLSLRH